MKGNTIPRNYFICTVQRSGKSWLCNMLTRLQHYGAPEEYLKLSKLKEMWGENALNIFFTEKDFSKIRDLVEELTTAKTGVGAPLGLVIQSSQINNIADMTGLSPVDVFKQLYKAFGCPEIFLLKRRDMAAQAVSHYFMVLTGIAHSYQADSHKEETYSNVEYSQKEILRWYNFTRNGYQFWENIFDKSNVTPKYVLYESLKNNLYKNIVDITLYINSRIKISPAQMISVAHQGPQVLSVTKKTDFTTEFKRYLASR